MARINPLDHPICLSQPQRVAASGWLEHIPFGLWIVDALRPELMVELGTQSGVSYCTFCQGIDMLQLNCQAYAIDTWEGDPQSGLYGPEVLQDLRAYHDPRYGGFSSLIVGRFDEAANRFADASIDLLHIDGYHSFEAVERDFETWLPRLSDRGVVLLHDVTVRDDGFGVWRLWSDVRSRGPSFLFTHGHGLGVVAPGSSPPEVLVSLANATDSEAAATREAFHQLGRRVSLQFEVTELEKRARERSANLIDIADAYSTAENVIADLKANHAEAQATIERVMAELKSVHSQVGGQQERIQSQQRMIQEQVNVISNQRAAIDVAEGRRAEAERTVQSLEARLAERNRTINSLSQNLATWEDHWTRTQRTASWALVMRLRRLRQLLAPDDGIARRVWSRVRGRVRETGSVERPSELADRHAAPLEEVQQSIAGPLIDSPSPDRSDEMLSSRGFDAICRAKLESFLASGAQLRFPNPEHPTVSIVIPVFNQAHLTLATLEAILAAGSSIPFEVVVVDNGSTDDTRKLAERVRNVHFHQNEENLGFGEACNLGVAQSVGRYICLLNNDSLPSPGWIEELARVIQSYPRCGAVGSRLVLPDGRLQEAGSIIWRDGSAAGYGRGDDPYAGPYSYIREVDFCSANGLLVRKDLYESVGGFDARYAPAYYEDVDLCLGIQEAGYYVLYAPRAVIIHLEHATSRRREAIELQRRNRERFRVKWDAVLDGRYVGGMGNEPRARDRRPGKRILVADDRVPENRMGSGFPRTRQLLHALDQSGFVITYLPTTDPRRVEPETSELEARGIEVLCGTADVRERLQGRDGLYDIILVSRPHNAWLLEELYKTNPNALVVYDAEALFSLREANRAEAQGEPLSAENVETSIASELAQVGPADLVITVTELERTAIRNQYPDANVAVWGHAIPVADAETRFDDRRDLLFVGYLGSEPNSDAVQYLIKEVMPRVHASTGCRLRVVGAGSGPDILAAASEAGDCVVMEGYVENLSAYYSQARAFVAPHRFAAGLPHKVGEAMAHGVPCVISELLATQLGITPEKEALVGADAQDFARKVIQIYQNKGLWTQIQRDSLRFVKNRYDPAKMRDALVGYLEDAAAARPSV
jgi:O-antigen biosynthesis protein